MQQLELPLGVGRTDAPVRHERYWHWLIGASPIPLLAAAFLLGGVEDRPGRETDRPSSLDNGAVASLIDPGATVPSDESPGHAKVSADGESVHDRVQITIEPGDSLERVFRRRGLSLEDLGAMARLPEAAEHLRWLSPGTRVAVDHAGGRVRTLELALNPARQLRIEREDAGFTVSFVDRAVETRTAVAHGLIRSSLFGAAHNAGLADALTLRMAEIFQSDIDFLMDVRVGDSFTVVYAQRWSGGTNLGAGEILAAEFVNGGRVHRAARYVDETGEGGYFTPQGRNVRRAFVRAPVDFTRISSVFDPNRRHPVLNTLRAHRGVDYAAPAGTPVRASGDGRVHFVGDNGGYGNTVILEHGGRVSTLYAHLSRFADVRIGDRVTQGQTIGYVGMSGLATGPHLHYEYRVGGIHRNPQTVEFASADPVPEAQRGQFEREVASLWQQLDRHRPTELAARVAR